MAPPVPVLFHTMQLAMFAVAPVHKMPPPALAVALFAYTVVLRMIGAELDPIQIAPPPPVPVAVLPTKMQL